MPLFNVMNEDLNDYVNEKKHSEATQTLRVGCSKADPRTNKQTHKQTHKQDRLQYSAPQLSAQCNYELGFVAFKWPNLCILDLSLLFIVLVGRNFVSDICKLKPKKRYVFSLKKTIFSSPVSLHYRKCSTGI